MGKGSIESSYTRISDTAGLIPITMSMSSTASTSTFGSEIVVGEWSTLTGVNFGKGRLFACKYLATSTTENPPCSNRATTVFFCRPPKVGIPYAVRKLAAL